MWIKPVAILLFIALVISLFSGLIFFIKDQGSSRRTYNSLGVRLAIAVALFAVIGYGLYTGDLGNRVPWDPSTNASSSAPHQSVAPKQQ
ncbi:MAG: DUF2909 domain-containing protein [Pseudomonadales bacterium]